MGCGAFTGESIVRRVSEQGFGTRSPTRKKRGNWAQFRRQKGLQTPPESTCAGAEFRGNSVALWRGGKWNQMGKNEISKAKKLEKGRFVSLGTKNERKQAKNAQNGGYWPQTRCKTCPAGSFGFLAKSPENRKNCKVPGFHSWVLMEDDIALTAAQPAPTAPGSEIYWIAKHKICNVRLALLAVWCRKTCDSCGEAWGNLGFSRGFEMECSPKCQLSLQKQLRYLKWDEIAD